MVLGVEEYDLSKEDSTGMKPLILFFFSPSTMVSNWAKLPKALITTDYLGRKYGGDE